jgi:hypothetical protein
VSDGHVQEGEFVRAIDALTAQMADVKAISRETLTEAKKTNGRVNTLEVARAIIDSKIKALEDRPEPVTKRDLWQIGVVLGIVFGAIRWLPVLVTIGGGAP